MTKVLYVAGELSSRFTNAAQVRVRALLPRIETNVALRVIGYSPVGETETTPDIGIKAPVEVLEQRRVTRFDLITATLRRTPRSFCRYDTDEARVALTAALREYRPDIVHFDGFATLALMPLVQQEFPSARIIAHIHDAQSVFQSRSTNRQPTSLTYKIQNKLEQLKTKMFERQQLGKASLTLVDSIEDRDFLRGAVRPGVVEFVPLGFEPTMFGSTGTRADLDQPAIVFSGSMKGPQSRDGALFLTREVMPLVWERQPGAHLYIVGGGPTDEVRGLGGGKIHVTGFVEDLAAYLRAGAVYCCPLRLGSGMRTRVVEALACGATVVATPLAVRGLTVPRQGAPWITAETATDFAQEITRGIEGAYPQLGTQAAAYIRESYSWESVAHQLIAFYSKLLSG